MTEIRRDQTPTLSQQARVRPRSPSEALEPGRAPVRPRSKKRRRQPGRKVSGFVRFFSGIMTLSLIGMAAIVAVSLLFFHQFERPGPLAVTQTVSIPKGSGRIEIAERLEKDGIISSRWAFVAGYMYLTRGGRIPGMDLKAGEYEIEKGASMRQVIDKLIEGKSVLYTVTIPEGLTSQQAVERLRSEPMLTGDITQVPAEGTLLPDTYSFTKGADRQEVLQRMAKAQDKVLATLWENRQQDLPVKTVGEALVLASIVEKETGRADERDKVAAVFVNRLRKGMRLQSDPTIIYGLVKGQGKLGRPLTKTDIASKTEYNTYHIKGLPPGPICNPGRAAIAAVLKPATTDALYFVADGTGGHKFSKTLKEHNVAVAAWRKIERQRREERKKALALQALSGGDAMALGGDIPNPLSTAQEDDKMVPPLASETKAAESNVKPLKGIRASTLPLPVRKPKP
jgi:peptidoglycan lytic transglycosylase G